MIREVLWPADRIEHITNHHITPNEYEQVCFGKTLILRKKSDGKNPVYLLLGRTKDGRYLACVIIQFPYGKGYPVTARDMTVKEKRRYNKWRNG